MMSYEPIEIYLNTVLAEQLNPLGVNPDFTEKLLGTARVQMQSLIYHWFDDEFCKAILRIGADEGVFYKPYAPDDIRNFVVVTIRNSEIECLHSDDWERYGLKDRLPENEIKNITSAAIEYWGKLDFNKMSDEIKKPVKDIYGELADKYPVTTQLLMELASNDKKSYDFEQIKVYNQPSLDALPILGEKNTAETVKRGEMITAWADGYAFAIDAKLKQQLLVCAKDGVPFVIDSFKSLSRNIEKVFLVFEFLTSRWIPIVSTNFFLVNGHIERRKKPLKAGHSHDEMFSNWNRSDGLGEYHKHYLDATTGKL